MAFGCQAHTLSQEECPKIAGVMSEYAKSLRGTGKPEEFVIDTYISSLHDHTPTNELTKDTEDFERFIRMIYSIYDPSEAKNWTPQEIYYDVLKKCQAHLTNS